MSEVIIGTDPKSQGSASGGDLVIDTTTSGFVSDVIEESKNRPVLVDFWAPWCGPCKTLSPIIEKAVTDARGAVKLAKMNIDEHPSIAGQLGIQSIPAVIAFVDGKPVDGFLGAVPESEVKAFIDKIAGAGGNGAAQFDEILAEADRALAAGETGEARELYAALLQADAESVGATIGLARIALAEGDAEQAAEILDRLPLAKADDAAVLAVRADIELAKQTSGLPDPAALLRRIEEDPSDFKARFDLALQHNARNERDNAVAQLLAIIGSDREWEDRQAHKQLLQFFDSWGPKDAATIAGRRRLSTLLFS